MLVALNAERAGAGLFAGFARRLGESRRGGDHAAVAWHRRDQLGRQAEEGQTGGQAGVAEGDCRPGAGIAGGAGGGAGVGGADRGNLQGREGGRDWRTAGGAGSAGAGQEAGTATGLRRELASPQPTE